MIHLNNDTLRYILTCVPYDHTIYRHVCKRWATIIPSKSIDIPSIAKHDKRGCMIQFIIQIYRPMTETHKCITYLNLDYSEDSIQLIRKYVDNQYTYCCDYMLQRCIKMVISNEPPIIQIDHTYHVINAIKRDSPQCISFSLGMSGWSSQYTFHKSLTNDAHACAKYILSTGIPIDNDDIKYIAMHDNLDVLTTIPNVRYTPKIIDILIKWDAPKCLEYMMSSNHDSQIHANTITKIIDHDAIKCLQMYVTHKQYKLTRGQRRRASNKGASRCLAYILSKK